MPIEPEVSEKPALITLPETLTVKRFAEILSLPVGSAIMELMKNKIMASINDEIDYETASIIAQDLGFLTEKDLDIKDGEALTLEKLIEICDQEKASGKNLQSRPAVVTILGHVDHGKTTLLDTIRKTSVAAGEVGGITQRISAYQVKKRGQLITFIDTPGHEAFSAMRQRGTSLADIAILVVAADDGVRPQTEEVIAYLKEKKLPVIVAITKIDKPETNIARVKQELAERDILIEEWGGKFLCVEVSAKTGKGMDDLLENILLVTEVEEFRADAKRDGLGVVLESHLDPKRGPLATVLIKTGTFKIGQDILAGRVSGRIRRIEDWTGKPVTQGLPAAPILISGLDTVPGANDVVQVMNAKMQSKLAASREKNVKSLSAEDNRKKLRLILKADTQGSLEAIEQILGTYYSDEVSIALIGTGVGNITESDIKLAETSDTIVYGFTVEATSVAKRMAEEKNVEIKTFKIIYELVDDVKARMETMLSPETIRTDWGTLEVLALFKTGKKDMIIGGRVLSGTVNNKTLLEVMRGESVIGRGALANLQQNKVDVNEAKKGEECGITFDGETKIKVGDTLLCFSEELKKKTVETR